MLHCNNSYGVYLSRGCGYCCVLAGGRYQRSDVPGPRCEAQARGAVWRSKASAQHGERAARRRSTATQHGATRRRMRLVSHRRNIPLSYRSDR